VIKVNIRVFYLAVVVCFGSTTVSIAQEKAAWWNPFKTTTTETSVGASSNNEVRKSTQFGGGGDGFKFPELKMPTWSDKVTSKSEPKKPKAPSTLSRMGATSKRWWNNTVDFVNPFDSKPEPQQQGYQPQNKTTTKKGSGPFGWMWREEETETPSNVNDFLRQPRVGFPGNP
jgi:hypothetical protein